MKKLLCWILFAFFLFVGTTSNAYVLDFDGGVELSITASKAGEIICIFDIPNKYIGKDGDFLLPFCLEVCQEHSTTYIIETKNNQVVLPELVGGYTITLKIGDYLTTHEEMD